MNIQIIPTDIGLGTDWIKRHEQQFCIRPGYKVKTIEQSIKILTHRRSLLINRVNRYARQGKILGYEMAEVSALDQALAALERKAA